MIMMKMYLYTFIIGASILFFRPMGVAGARALSLDMLTHGLENADLAYYSGDDAAGGLAHVDYWTIDLAGLTGRELEKARKIRSNQLHSSLFQPYQAIAGHEVTGILDRIGRRQWITFKLPEDWNGNLVVCGTPGLRNEYANEATLVPWLLDAGYAVISGNKGLESSWVSMLSGLHPSRYWGKMMHDMAIWAKFHLLLATGRWARQVYAVGLSNGGYQVRRALEIDAGRPRWLRIFDGGLDWSGTYFASRAVLDSNRDGQVSIQEYAAARSLVAHMDVATLTMGWAYSPDTLTTPEHYAQSPRYPDARAAMTGAGFTAGSDIFWGLYNTNYDYYRHYPGLEQWKGVGYQNLVSYVYRAELLGHDLEASEAYSCFADPAHPDEPPPIYAWLENAEDGGWTAEGVQYALANANTARFKVPMITVVGSKDGLLAMNAHSAAYRQAVEKYGRPELYRQYIIENGPHVDAHADGLVDFDFDGADGNEKAADELTPMQAYAQRAFQYLIDWVEKGRRPPDSKIVATDPVDDVDDPSELSW
jgi:hypothetical protein